jgi:hypothetical protein
MYMLTITFHCDDGNEDTPKMVFYPSLIDLKADAMEILDHARVPCGPEEEEQSDEEEEEGGDGEEHSYGEEDIQLMVHLTVQKLNVGFPSLSYSQRWSPKEDAAACAGTEDEYTFAGDVHAFETWLSQ